VPSAGRWRAVQADPHPDVCVLLCLPEAELSTARARAMLPLQVPHADAAHAAGRAALLVHALTREPGLLLEATEDLLHQRQRGAAMPASWELLQRLRGAGHAAVVSGAGPSLLVLTRPAGVDAVTELTPNGWRCLTLRVDQHGAHVSAVPGAVSS
jgi:homoserine kinase